MDAAVNLPLQQTRRFQHAQVLGNRWKRHVKRLGKLGNFGFAARQPREDGAARGIGERAESGVQRIAEIVNHTV